MRKETDGLIFDLDGVLVFTDRYHYLAWKQIADEMHVPFDEATNNRLRGVSRMQSLEIILEKYSGKTLTPEEKIGLAERKNSIYRSFLSEMSPDAVSPEVRETLAELRKRGYRLAVGSSSKNAAFILERVCLTEAFDALSDGNNITHSKPDPEVFFKAAEMLGLAPEKCAVVEDAEAGIDAALSGGMLAVAIGDAAKCGRANLCISRFSDLLKKFV